MAQRDVGFGTYTAGEAIGAFIRVYLSAENTVSIAGVGVKGVGITQEAIASGAEVTVKEWNAEGTHRICAADSWSAAANLYYAASGKFTDTANTGDVAGVALHAATGANGLVEMISTGYSAESGGVAVASIDDDSGGTTGGTEQLNPIVTAAIDDDSGGTTGGTEHYTDVLATQTSTTVAEGTLGGTDGGTETTKKVRGSGYSGGAVADISDNLQVLRKEVNNLRADLANVVTNANNDLKVTSAQLNLIRTNGNNNFKVLSTQLNALLTSLRNAGLLRS